MESFPSCVCCFPSVGAEPFTSHSPGSGASGAREEGMPRTGLLRGRGAESSRAACSSDGFPGHRTISKLCPCVPKICRAVQ